MRLSFSWFLFLVLLSFQILAQQKRVDSLVRALPLAQDTNRVNALLKISRELLRNKPVDAKKYVDEAYSISQNCHFERGEATCLLRYGLVAYYSGNYNLAERKYMEALALAQKIHNLKVQASIYINLGLLSEDRGNYNTAISYCFKGMELAEELHDESTVARAFNNLGNLYGKENNQDLSLEYHRRSLAKQLQLGDKEGIASSYTNIGLVFKRKKQMDSCIRYYVQALTIRQELEDSKGIALVLNNLASIYLENGDYREASKRFRSVIAMCKTFGDQELACHAFINLAQCSEEERSESTSLIFLDSAMQIAIGLESKELIMQTDKQYSLVYGQQKNFGKAILYDEAYGALKDSLYNLHNQKTIFEMQSRYESEKKASQLDLLQKSSELEAVRLKNDRVWMGMLGAGVIFLFMLASLIYTRTRVKSKANRILQTQNNLIAKQKDEITDSIAYAQNIQQSMLPSRETLARNLPEYFILYKPKDIVSGDFYFFEKTGSKLILSAVDCTGHGVPGALLSFLGMDILQEAVHRKGIINPAGLLQYLDAEINRRLRKTAAEGSIRDGMDLAICTIDLESRKLEFAGAFNPIYIVSEGVLEEIKPDKLAIGSGQEGAGLSFKCHTRQLKKGDCIYLLSDGYADQFGGPAGKKFKYKPLKELLTLNFNRTMKEQEQILEKVFVEWKGSLFQVDDILIMGIRV